MRGGRQWSNCTKRSLKASRCPALLSRRRNRCRPMGKDLSQFELIGVLKDVIPNDHPRQWAAQHYLEPLLNEHKDMKRVLDLGCGDGRSVDVFRKYRDDLEWIGLDIEESPEVSLRTREDATFHSYDGVNIPFEDDAFDLIYSHQVFEHVRFPAELLKEAARVLRPDGLFVGSTSHLEPFHSWSFFNYTPYGFKTLLEAAGFEVLEIRPGIDSLSLIWRRLLNRPRFFGRWFWSSSPLNTLFRIFSKFRKRTAQELNARQLLFCGQFTWLARVRQNADSSGDSGKSNEIP